MRTAGPTTGGLRPGRGKDERAARDSKVKRRDEEVQGSKCSVPWDAALLVDQIDGPLFSGSRAETEKTVLDFVW